MAFTVFWGRPASVPHARQTKACDTGGFVSAAASCADQANAAVANPRIILARETQPEAGHESRRDSACEQAAPCSEEQAAFNHVSVAFARAIGQLESVPGANEPYRTFAWRTESSHTLARSRH